MNIPIIAWTFPGGRRVIKEIVATAGDVVVNLSPGAGKRWIVLFGRVTLVADGNAANRLITFTTTDGTNTTSDIGYNSTAITASQTKSVTITSKSMTGQGAGLTDLAILGLPIPCILEGLDQLHIAIAAGVAGDSYTGWIVVLEMPV